MGLPEDQVEKQYHIAYPKMDVYIIESWLCKYLH